MKEHTSHHSVVIVGAGISGLTAARELIKDFPDLLIVEARKQKGGRVCEVSQDCSAQSALRPLLTFTTAAPVPHT